MHISDWFFLQTISSSRAGTTSVLLPAGSPTTRPNTGHEAGTRSVECVINRSTSASPTHLFFHLFFSCNSKNKFKVGYYLAIFPSCLTPSPFYSPNFSGLLFFLWTLSNPQVKTANFGLRDCKYGALTHPLSVSLHSAAGQMSQVTPAAEAEPSGRKPSHTCN